MHPIREEQWYLHREDAALWRGIRNGALIGAGMWAMIGIAIYSLISH